MPLHDRHLCHMRCVPSPRVTGTQCARQSTRSFAAGRSVRAGVGRARCPAALQQAKRGGKRCQVWIHFPRRSAVVGSAFRAARLGAASTSTWPQEATQRGEGRDEQRASSTPALHRAQRGTPRTPGERNAACGASRSPAAVTREQTTPRIVQPRRADSRNPNSSARTHHATGRRERPVGFTWPAAGALSCAVVEDPSRHTRKQSRRQPPRQRRKCRAMRAL